MSRVVLALALCGVVAACRKTPCEELQPVPIAGSYRGGGSLGEERLLKVNVEAESKEVLLSYTLMDGTRIRAKYRVLKKVKRK